MIRPDLVVLPEPNDVSFIAPRNFRLGLISCHALKVSKAAALQQKVAITAELPLTIC
jgi:hypothetical protein